MSYNNRFKLISLKFFFTAILFLVSIFIFAFIAHEVVLEKEASFDEQVSALFSPLSSPSFIEVMKVFTFFGSIWFLLPAYIVLISYLFFRKKYMYGIDIAIIGSTSYLLVQALKLIFHRQRPNLPIIKGISTYSFPSGHTLSAFIFFSILIFIADSGKWKAINKWIVSIVLILFAIMIGISRIVLQVHYATDVIASFCLGIAWTIVSFAVLKALDRQYMVNRKNTR